MIIRRLTPEWYRLDSQGSPCYVDIRKVDDWFWQGSIKKKDTHAEVDHTALFRRLADVRQAPEQLVAELIHSTEEPDEA
jgi:hypothetical protein